MSKSVYQNDSQLQNVIATKSVLTEFIFNHKKY